ncbi:Os01g0546100, partial [Oryza sativa Japonica Group]
YTSSITLINLMGNREVLVVAFFIRSIYGGVQIVTKIAFNRGMSTTVFVFYRHAIAILFLVPVAFVVERKTAPPLSYKILLKLFVHALYGIAGSVNIYGLGLSYSSATSSSAISNLLPVLAFFLAVLMGMESLNLKRIHGIAKVFGVLFSIVGVIILAFYQGPELKSLNLQHLSSRNVVPTGSTAYTTKAWTSGIFLTVLSTTSWALWTVLQGLMLEVYPSKLLNTTIQMVFATIQCFFIALAVERDFSRWKLGLDAGLIAVIYSGALVSGLAYYMQVWVIDKSGPVFLAMTMPITLIVTIVLSSFVLGEAVTLGSIISGVVMVGGLYCVLWAKKAEQAIASKEEATLPVQATQV